MLRAMEPVSAGIHSPFSGARMGVGFVGQPLVQALAILVVGLTLSVAAWWQLQQIESRTQAERFELRLDDIAEAIDNRIANYRQVLRGMRGFFAGSAEVSRAEWDAYVAQVNITEHFPGISGLGYLAWVPADQLTAFVNRTGQSQPGFAVTPKGQRNGYAPVLYSYSVDVQEPPYGTDLYADPVRRETLQRARDSAKAALSERVTLAQDSALASPPPASLLTLAIYRRGAATATLAQRQAALQGFVLAVFRIQDLMQGLLGKTPNDIRLEIFDGASPEARVRLYDTGAVGGVQSSDALQHNREIDVAGRTWMLHATALPAFNTNSTNRAPTVLGFGVVVSLLLFLLVLALRRSEIRAQSLAEQMTSDLRSAEDRHGKIVENSADGILTLNEQGQVQTFNRAAGRIFGYAAREVVGKDVSMLLSDSFTDLCQQGLEQFHKQDERGRSGMRREVEGKRRTGELFPVQVALNVMAGGGRVQLVVLISDISERKRTEDRIRHIAHHDALTGLPNRYLLMDRLGASIQQSQRAGTRVGVMMIDIDHFKRINDSLGHHAGDRLLLSIAERLQTCIKSADTVARMGGDEFVVVLPDLVSRDDAERIAQRIVEQVSQPMMVGSQELHVTPSVGVCLFPDDGDDPRTLLKNADSAMYEAKSQGRANVQWFTAGMQQQAQQKLELESEFRRALEREEFVMYYQPLLSVDDVQLLGMEALVRWNHPQRGLVMPDRFIPMAEESGLIVPLGEYVLRRSCMEAQQMRLQSGLALNVAVNASPRQFQEKNFIDVVRRSLRDSQLPPEALTLEITETVLADRPDETVELLREIRAMGVMVAADDFGTGYSSLSYVTRFPITKLKVDRSFVRDVTDDAADAAVTGAIIAMAHSLRLKVVAEGVETLSQLAFLRAHRCDEAQGYLFGAAMPPTEFLRAAMNPESLKKNLIVV